MDTTAQSSHRHRRRLLGAAGGLVLVAAAWFALAPPQLGGSLSYVVTAGTSMQPRFHTGDLALVRPQSSYAIGEIVAYRSPRMHAIVLHRIVARDGDRYVFKGDNNSWNDPVHPTRAQLIGKLWLRIPSAGRLIASRTPDELAFLAAGGVLLLLGGTGAATHRRRSRRRREQTRMPPRLSPAAGEGARLALGVSAVALLIFGALAALAFTQPTSRLTTATAGYKQTGRFSYSAAAPAGIVYASRRVRTGDPVYLHLVNELQVRFAYRLSANAPHTLHGTGQLTAELADTSGWRHTLILEPPTGFEGDRATLNGTLRLSELTALLLRFEADTGATGSSYTLTLRPEIHVDGTLAGQRLTERFTPALLFTLGALQLTPAPPRTGAAEAPTGSKAADPLAPVAPGVVTFRQSAPASLALSKLRLPVTTARRTAEYGAAASLVALLFTALLFLRGRRADEPERIRARYGHLLIPVTRSDRRFYDEVVEVATIDALAQLATRYDRMILHEHSYLGHSYRVADESVLYVYILGNPRTGGLPSITLPLRGKAAADESRTLNDLRS
jgi:signal peptidase I